MKNNNSIVVELSPEEIDEEVKAFMYQNRRRASAIRLMDTDWPQAPTIRAMLVNYAGLHINNGSVPVVLSAIDRGALSYERRLGTKPDWLRLTGFLDVTIKAISKELVGLTVVGTKGNVWHPTSGLALSTWMIKEKEAKIVTTSHSTANELTLIRQAIMRNLHVHLPKTATGVFNGK